MFAGILRAAPEVSWPAPGQRLPAGQILGAVDVRVGPEMRVELQNKVNAARLKQRGEEEVVKIRERTAASLKKVTDQKILSRAELDAAEVQLAEAKIQLTTAEAEVTLWEQALRDVERHKDRPNSVWTQPLLVPSDGEVTELAARPGMAVEPGTLILQLVDSRRPLVRLDIPADAFLVESPPDKVTLEAASAVRTALTGVLSPPPESKLRATRTARLVGPAPAVDVSAQLIPYWYEVQPAESAADGPPLDSRADAVWRPGMQVKAALRPPGSISQAAVAIPASAVLFHEGHSLTYVRITHDTYERREVRLLERDGESWIISPRTNELRIGVDAGEMVVCRQSQVLLSKEFLKGGGEVD